MSKEPREIIPIPSEFFWRDEFRGANPISRLFVEYGGIPIPLSFEDFQHCQNFYKGLFRVGAPSTVTPAATKWMTEIHTAIAKHPYRTTPAAAAAAKKDPKAADAPAQDTKTVNQPQVPLNTVKAHNATLKADNATLKADNAIAKADNVTVKADNATLKADTATLKAELAALRKSCEAVPELTATVNGLKDEITALQADLKAFRDDNAALKARQDATDKNATHAVEKLKAPLKAQLQSELKAEVKAALHADLDNKLANERSDRAWGHYKLRSDPYGRDHDVTQLGQFRTQTAALQRVLGLEDKVKALKFLMLAADDDGVARSPEGSMNTKIDLFERELNDVRVAVAASSVQQQAAAAATMSPAEDAKDAPHSPSHVVPAPPYVAPASPPAAPSLPTGRDSMPDCLAPLAPAPRAPAALASSMEHADPHAKVFAHIINTLHGIESRLNGGRLHKTDVAALLPWPGTNRSATQDAVADKVTQALDRFERRFEAIEALNRQMDGRFNDVETRLHQLLENHTHAVRDTARVAEIQGEMNMLVKSTWHAVKLLLFQVGIGAKTGEDNEEVGVGTNEGSKVVDSKTSHNDDNNMHPTPSHKKDDKKVVSDSTGSSSSVLRPSGQARPAVGQGRASATQQNQLDRQSNTRIVVPPLPRPQPELDLYCISANDDD